MKKRVLLISANGRGPDTGFGSRVSMMGNALSEVGMDVVLLRFYPAFRGSGRWLYRRHYLYRIVQVPILPISRYSFFRWISLFSANIFVYVYAKLMRIDYIQVESHEAAYLVNFVFRPPKPVVVDFHGAVVEEAVYAGRKAVDRTTWHDLSEKAAINTSMHFFVSEKLREHIYSKHPHAVKVPGYIVPINADRVFFDVPLSKQVRTKLGVKNDDLLFVYSGGLQAYQCISQMLGIFSEIAKKFEDAKLLILTLERDKLQQMLDPYGDLHERFVVRSATSKQEVAEYLCGCDAAFLLREEEVLNSVSCPTKLGEYIACGLPVITTPWAGNAPTIIAEYKLGVVIDLNNQEDSAVMNFVGTLPMDPEQVRQVARKTVCWDKCISTLRAAYFVDHSRMSR